MFERQHVDRALSIFQDAKRLCCMCHRNPDGDAIGSLTAVGALLEQRYPDTPVELYCVDPSPPTFHFLPPALRIRHDLQPRAGDAFVIVDCAEPHLTEYHEQLPQIFDGSYPTVCFDHHFSNSQFASVNFIFPDQSSTCEVLVGFADAAGWSIDADVATCLMLGLYTDTGGLLHSNTSAKVYRTAARLLRSGARQQSVVKNVFRTAKISTLRLWGRVLEKISVTDEGAAVSALTEGDFRATGAEYSELTGAIDYVNAVPGMKFSLVLAERAGKVKGSLRTLRDDVDVSAMAQKFKGGGHRKAAGFAVTGKLKPEMRWKVEEEAGS